MGFMVMMASLISGGKMNFFVLSLIKGLGTTGWTFRRKDTIDLHYTPK